MQEDYELTLFDRINAIKDNINKYGEENFYLSFSGGKDSTILHYLLDLALPNNKIPRVYINTGIEYTSIIDFVKSLQEKDNRIEIIQPSVPIKKMLEKYGYPFKSKQHSHNVGIYQTSGELTKTTKKYLGIDGDKPTMFQCPTKLKYQFTKEFNIKLSDKCCYKLKKEPIAKWQKENKKSITMTGMRKEEGGNRNNLTCIVTDKDKKVIKFHPLSVVDEKWCEWFINKYDIKLCELYYEPFNFKRTGCKGCPFALNLQDELNKLEEYLPNELKHCEMIWKPIYDEYRRIGYRLNSDKQLTIFDFIKE